MTTQPNVITNKTPFVMTNQLNVITNRTGIVMTNHKNVITNRNGVITLTSPLDYPRPNSHLSSHYPSHNPHNAHGTGSVHRSSLCRYGVVSRLYSPFYPSEVHHSQVFDFVMTNSSQSLLANFPFKPGLQFFRRRRSIAKIRIEFKITTRY